MILLWVVSGWGHAKHLACLRVDVDINAYPPVTLNIDIIYFHVHVCGCTDVCGYMCAHVCICMHMHEEVREQLPWLGLVLSLVWDLVSHWPGTLPNLLDYLGSWVPWIHHLPSISPTLEWQVCSTGPSSISWRFWAFRLSPLHLQGKCFTDWAIAPAPKSHFN